MYSLCFCARGVGRWRFHSSPEVWSNIPNPQLIREIDFWEELAIDKFAKDMTEQDVRFLNSWGFTAWNAKQHFDAVLHFSPGLSGKANCEQAFCSSNIDGFDHAGRVSTGGDSDRG